MRMTVPHAPYVMTLRVELGPQPTLLTVTEYLDLFLINSRSRARCTFYSIKESVIC